MSETSGPPYSVSFRLLRTTTEYAFVSVPLTADLTIAQPGGNGRIDVDKMVQRAVEMAKTSVVSWQQEEQHVEPHPVQMAPPKKVAE
jgi:mannose/fructose-specific phosphotransferase system component IIA